MNDIVNNLKALFIKAENERKQANRCFKQSRSQNCFGDCSRLDDLELITNLCEKLKSILNGLTSKQDINVLEEAETIFEIEGSIFHTESCSIFHNRARVMGVV